MDEHHYCAAERALWHHVGLEPIEHWIRLPRSEVDVRVLEVGDGPPVLFIHGGPGAAGPIWADLAAHLPGWRCLLVGRPGTGLSDPHLLTDAASVRREAETMVPDVLDGLGVDRAHLVGSSHGSHVAVLSSVAHPDRVQRTVHIGCPGFIQGMNARGFDRVILLPGATWLFGRMPTKEKGIRQILRQLGHGAPSHHARSPQPMIDWFVAPQRHTDSYPTPSRRATDWQAAVNDGYSFR